MLQLCLYQHIWLGQGLNFLSIQNAMESSYFSELVETSLSTCLPQIKPLEVFGIPHPTDR